MRAQLITSSALFAALLAGCGMSSKYAPDVAASKVAAPAPVAAEAPPNLSREAYDRIVDNPFFDVKTTPLSTFSIDVDTAAYANMRRFLNQGSLPPKDAVRIEELINYFSYDYPDPSGPDPFSVQAEVSEAPWNPAHRLVHIGVQGKRIDVRNLPPSNLVFLLDVSGSMNSPDKLPLLKQAFGMLTEQMRPQDRVAIVVYAGAAGLVLDSTQGTRRGTIMNALNRLSAGGSTAGGAGIQLAYEVARKHFIKGGNNRVILATDGDFNVGVSSDGALERLIEKERESGVFLTVLGFGTGNYQDAKMEKLSNAGNGNAAYIDSALEARKVLVTEMGGTLLTIAKDVKIQVEFNPAKVQRYRLIGYENRILNAQDFNDDKKDAGELGAGHSVTALYEVVPVGAPTPKAGVDPLKYQTVKPSVAAHSAEMMTVKLRYKQPDGATSKLITGTVTDDAIALGATSPAFRFSSAVAEFGLLLRDSKYKGNAAFGNLIARAEASRGADPHGYRADFIALARKAADLQAR
jgi:Ca-activated chloride channel family protein